MPGGRERFDAVVIGANIRGLVAAYVLQQLGHRVLLVERGNTVGGIDASFSTEGGARFDHGLHVLDDMRSPLATRLFTQVTDGAVHRVTLRRGVVLRGHVLPYAPKPSELPAELRDLLRADDIDDDIGDGPTTREAIGRCYGRGFADLVFDEILPSYPTESRHRRFGVDESELLVNVYPWLFPRARRPDEHADESRRFHDRLRSGIPQSILYPRSGGFGGFADAFHRSLDPDRVEVVTGADDLEIALEAGTQSVAEIRFAGRTVDAESFFWASGWAGLCGLLDLPCQHTATDRIVLGSFVLDRPATTPYHEILFGDPSCRINRLSLPGRFRESDEPLLQVEFAFPEAEAWPRDARHWQSVWLRDLRRLGILDADHVVHEFDCRQFSLHFNGYGMEGEALVDADPGAIRDDSNIVPLAPSMANLNLNRYVPRTVEAVTRRVARFGLD